MRPVCDLVTTRFITLFHFTLIIDDNLFLNRRNLFNSFPLLSVATSTGPQKITKNPFNYPRTNHLKLESVDQFEPAAFSFNII